MKAVLLSLIMLCGFGAQAEEALPAPPPGTKRTFIGFRLTKIDPNSIYAKVGLREGDLLKTLNGKPVVTPDDLKELPRLLDRDKKVELKVERGEKRVTLRYSLKSVPGKKPVAAVKAKAKPKKVAVAKKPSKNKKPASSGKAKPVKVAKAKPKKKPAAGKTSKKKNSKES